MKSEDRAIPYYNEDHRYDGVKNGGGTGPGENGVVGFGASAKDVYYAENDITNPEKNRENLNESEYIGSNEQ